MVDMKFLVKSMNIVMNTEYFNKLIGQRLRFLGTYDGAVKLYNGQYRVCFINVREVSSHKKFRKHVNILCPESVYLHCFENALGNKFQFTAELYNYTKKPYKGIYYRTWSVGLRDIRKLEQMR